MSETGLERFVRESNLIEGIDRTPKDFELEAHRRLLACVYLTVKSIEDFVFDICGQRLRRESGMNVRVGPHVPRPGGPWIETELQELIGRINAHTIEPYPAHIRYERLHPFIDGNGRSGRAIWALMMRGRDPFSLPFLHRWYYQSLNASRGPEA